MDELYKKPLGEILIARQAITQDQLEIALAEQRKNHQRLGDALVALGFVTEEQITEARALQLGVSYINLETTDLDPSVSCIVSECLAREYRLVPVSKEGNKLTIAMANPLDVEAIELVQVETKCWIEPALATEWRIMEAIDREYGTNCDGDIQEAVDEAGSEFATAATTTSDEYGDDLDSIERQSRNAPVIRMVNSLLTEAVRRKSSDIHIEPRRNTVDIRYRIDGDLRLVRTLPKALHAPVSSRIKVMSDLDISERRLPQDGRITRRVDGKNIDFRVSTNPTLHGERIVLRILDRSRGIIPLENLGFSKRDLRIFQALVSQPHGIVLVTGPTGSGKTTTLYAALNMIRSERINIMTVEDPIEYELDGINQTNVHAKIGLTFANQLRTILRQDPDVVLVGEIRDAETADIAFRAALTGHLVLSALHCNDAPSAITRLTDMDVEPFLVSSAIVGVQAQRLVRMLCPACKEPYEPDVTVKTFLGLRPDADVTLYKPGGCRECDNIGYKGRTTILEIMVMNDELSRLALAKASAAELREAALRNGMIGMRQDAAQKVLAGITTVEEVQRKLFMEADLITATLKKDSEEAGQAEAPDDELAAA